MGMRALFPLVFFLAVYLGGSIALGDFYKIPLSVAFLAAAVLSVAMSRGRLSGRVRRFSAGAGSRNIMLMVWIYVLAGGFASSARSMGAVDAAVALVLHVMPGSMVMLSLFVAAAFVSISIGTSVGTIVALTPIAVGMSGGLGLSPAVLASVVVGGSYFGDNLSFISDTTVAATQTQGCQMSDKFRMNVRMIWPAVVAMLVLYVVWGRGVGPVGEVGGVDFVKVVPYATVLGLSALGLDVLFVLSVGIVLSGVIGVVSGATGFWDFLSSVDEGVVGMGELIVVALLAGGMLELIRANGGVRALMGFFEGRIGGRRGAELSIGALVSVTNLCTANNTVAIITAGRIARDVAQRYGVDPRRAASILDTCSCAVQGLIPYSVQILLASKLAGCTPLEILPTLFYPMLIGVCVLVSMIVGPRGGVAGKAA